MNKKMVGEFGAKEVLEYQRAGEKNCSQISRGHPSQKKELVEKLMGKDEKDEMPEFVSSCKVEPLKDPGERIILPGKKKVPREKE